MEDLYDIKLQILKWYNIANITIFFYKNFNSFCVHMALTLKGLKFVEHICLEHFSTPQCVKKAKKENDCELKQMKLS